MRLFALAPLLALVVAAHADQAIVVGINQYQTPKAPILAGPENDARDMAAFCRSHGYVLSNAHFLLGKAATGSAIVAALKGVEKTAKPGERVLFYFAGHGCNHGTNNRPQCAILPWDFVPGKAGTDIGVDKLYEMMKTMPKGGNRTVILDSCFSGGMARDLEFRSRSFNDIGSRSVVPMIDDTQAHVGVPKASTQAEADKICYLTAAKASEEALEIDLDDGKGRKAHGLFTHALIPQLAKNGTCGQVSAATQADIARIIQSKRSTRKQTPDVTDEYRNLPALTGTLGKTAPPPPVPKSVWEMIARERPDPTKVSLTAVPARSDLRLGQSLHLKVVVGAKGYLVVLWSKDEVSVQAPTLGPGQHAYHARLVQPGEYDLSDENESKAFDTPGGNRVSAFLFTAKAPAQRLLDAFNQSSVTVEDLIHGQGLVDLAGAGEGECYTSGLSFEVGAQILGGYVVTDAAALCDALLTPGGPLESEFNRVDPDTLARLKAARDANMDRKRLSELVTMAVNIVIESLASAKKPHAWIDPDTAPATVREAARKVDGELATAKPDEAAALNARLLAAFLPKCVKAVTP